MVLRFDIYNYLIVKDYCQKKLINKILYMMKWVMRWLTMSQSLHQGSNKTDPKKFSNYHNS